MNIVKNQTGFAHPVGVSLVAVVLLVVGFAGYKVSTSQEDSKQLNSTEQTIKTDDVLPINLNGVLEVSKVKELAVVSTSSTVSNLELENEDGKLVYKVTLSDGSVIVLDAKTGAKIATTDGTKELDVDEDEDILPANFTVSVSFEAARKIAQDKFPSGTISKIELDVEEGKVVLSVRFADKARVDVDANTGSIVRVKDPKSTQRAQPATKTSSSSDDTRDDDSVSNDTGSDTSGSNSGSGSSDDRDDSESDDSTEDSSGSNSGSGSSDDSR